MTEEKVQKKIRAVEKKLRQVVELKELKAGGAPRSYLRDHISGITGPNKSLGERCGLMGGGHFFLLIGKALEKTQLEKIENESKIAAELELLEKKLGELQTKEVEGRWR